MRDSVFPVVLRPSSVRIKNKSLAHRPWVGGRGVLRDRDMASDRAVRCSFLIRTEEARRTTENTEGDVRTARSEAITGNPEAVRFALAGRSRLSEG
jgi:hypothetical protein